LLAVAAAAAVRRNFGVPEIGVRARLSWGARRIGVPGVARRLRIQFPGARYHVINRGNLRHDIFATAGARRGFIRVTDEACGKFGWRMHVYVIMRNHFHFALKEERRGLLGAQWEGLLAAELQASRRTDADLNVASGAMHWKIAMAYRLRRSASVP
jgi:hypothetical protein